MSDPILDTAREYAKAWESLNRGECPPPCPEFGHLTYYKVCRALIARTEALRRAEKALLRIDVKIGGMFAVAGHGVGPSDTMFEDAYVALKEAEAAWEAARAALNGDVSEIG